MTSPLRVPSARARAVLLGLWSCCLALLLLGPALAPGFALSYDMVWVPDLAVRPDVWGLGSSLPRAVPSDAVVAVLDEVVPGQLLQKAVLVGALVGGGLGAARLVPRSLVVQVTAVAGWQWNPFVVERLVLGHWPVLVAYGALPWVLLLGARWRRTGRPPRALPALVVVGSLSASAGLATAVALTAAAVGRGRRRALLALVVAANAPWLVAGALHAPAATGDPRGAGLFALAGEGLLPGPLAALTLGGVWNVEVVPASREGVLGPLATVVVLGAAAVGARSWLRSGTRRDRAALVWSWVVGWSLGVLTWGAPGAVGWLATTVPGAGVLRDGGRLLLLCAPLTVVLVAHGVDRTLASVPSGGPARGAVAVAAALLPVALLPDAALGASGRLGAVDYPASYAAVREAVADLPEAVRGDVLLLPASSYRQPEWNADRKVLDPLARLLPTGVVASDVLVVSGTRVPGEDPRFQAVERALDLPEPSERSRALGALGVGAVVIDRAAPGRVPELVAREVLTAGDLEVQALPTVRPAEPPSWWVVALVPAWVAWAASPLAGVVRRRRPDPAAHRARAQGSPRLR